MQQNGSTPPQSGWTRAGNDRSLTAWSLIGLAAGAGLGLAGHAAEFRPIEVLAAVVSPLGQVWLNALQLIILPLVATQMLVAVTGVGAHASLGRLSLRTIGLIVLFLTLGGAFTVAVGLPTLSLFRYDAATVEAASVGVAVPDAAEAAASAGGGGWFTGLVPANLFQAALDGEILAVLLFAVAFGLAVRQLPPAQRGPMSALFAGAAAAMMQIVRWILVVTPIGVFALMLEMTLSLGLGAVGILGGWIIFSCALLIAFNGLLYPITAVLGGISMRRFARAVAPAQIVALGTRSSLACLPVLVEHARAQLRLPEAATAFVLPLCVTIFKQNRTISSTAKLLFLAHVFGVPLSVGGVLIFFVTVLLLSFSAVGVPRGGTAFTTLPAYLAAGLPIQGVVVLETVETIPDFFKTVLNVTADMSVAVISFRGASAPMPATAPPQAEPMPEYAGAL